MPTDDRDQMALVTRLLGLPHHSRLTRYTPPGDLTRKESPRLL
jgi:hypothetical protein